MIPLFTGPWEPSGPGYIRNRPEGRRVYVRPSEGGWDVFPSVFGTMRFESAELAQAAAERWVEGCAGPRKTEAGR